MPYRERPAENEDIEGRIFLSERDAREAARLLRMLSEVVGYLPEAPAPAGEPPGPEELAARARIILHSRRAREHYFKRAMFGEPAWDILLVLYVSDLSGGRQTISKLADWIETPLSTVIRWIGYLEKERLVERHPHPTDKRTVFIRMLPKGRQAMGDYLTEMGWRPAS